MDNLAIYNALKQPPKEALKRIEGGRLSGKTDINPQWRYKAMTEQFGICGIGWKYEIVRVFSEPGDEGQVFAFAEVNLFIKQGEWSCPIPGYGGSMLVEKEKAGLHANDEGYKMAITDALSTSMKMLGVAADVYAGLWDGTKYTDSREETKEHWCPIHRTIFFKKGKMKGYAHSIKDETGNDTGEWCNEIKEQAPEDKLEAEIFGSPESKTPAPKEKAKGTPPPAETPETDTDVSKQAIAEAWEKISKESPSGKAIQNVTELKSLLMKHKIPTHEAYVILSIKSYDELKDLDKAWEGIKKAKGIEP